MSETVFILGAGVSKGAGAPLMNEFLDTADRLRKTKGTGDADFDLVFHGLNALQAVHSKGTMDLLNLESVVAAFEMAKLLGKLGSLPESDTDALPGAMIRVIQRTLEATISFPVDGQRIRAPRPYEELASMLAKLTSIRSRVSFLTFNYDICLDFALHTHSIPLDYCLEPTTGSDGVKLLKLHGSMNWSQCRSCKKIVPLGVGEFVRSMWRGTPGLLPVQIVISRGLSRLIHCGGSLPEEPFIAPPTWDKTQHHHQLGSVWRAAAHELSEAENIIICGYSLPDTDQFFRYLYALGSIGGAGLKTFWVVNPDPAVEQKFRGLCGPLALSRFKFFPRPIEQTLTEIRRFFE
jgi:hypothetical protein